MADEEVLGFYVLGPFRAGDITIFREGKGAHIILINDVGIDLISLSLEELAKPLNIADLVVQSYKLTLT